MNPERWKQIDELFDAVLDLPENERERFLTEKTGNDTELKNEVLSLLKAQTGTDNFLENSAMGIAAKHLAEENKRTSKSFYLNKKIGNYEIVSMLGSGGMGEVYLAKDDKLKRKVALKILPAEFVADDERVKRFQGEARAISALNHPNIVTIYDVGTFENINFIATEYVEGKTLREIIGSGLKLKELLQIVIQCCDALSAAHAAGIIHRDIKPENIMIRPDGYVKILDLGLAKLTDVSPQTFKSMAKTAKGIIIGTPAYMSPEQVTDDRVDHRTDLWSIGVVLYELITGVNPFKKENRQATFQAILASEPPFPSSINSEVTPELDQILFKALEKEADLSYQTASDLRADLKRVRREMDSSPSLRSSSRSMQTVNNDEGKRRFPVIWLFVPVLLVLIGFAVWFFVYKFNQKPDAPDWTRAKNIQLSDQSGIEQFPSLSPDGKNFVFSKIGETGNFDIFSQRIGGNNTVNLTPQGDFADTQPAFSPDGEFIVFRSEREPPGIYVMGASGENPRRISDFGFHPAWSPDGKQIAVSTNRQDYPTVRSRGAIWTINVESGEKRMLIDNFALQPNWSPNGKRIAYWFTEKGGKRNVATIPAEGGEPLVTTDSGNTNWNPVWSPDGNFLYFAGDAGGSMAFWRVRIDQETGKTLDEPEIVPTPAKYNRHLSFSADGKKLIYVQTENESNLKSVPFDVNGEKTDGEIKTLTSGDREITNPELSPDGKTFVVRQYRQTQEDIVLLNADGSFRRELTNDKYFDRYPHWSPDGKQIVFISDRSGKYELWRIDTDGTNLKQLTNINENAASMPAWSPDGTRISFDDTVNSFIFDAQKEAVAENMQKLPAPTPENYIRIWDWSPDGKKVVGYVEQGAMNGIVIYDFETGRFEKVGEYTGFNFWLPDSRRIILIKDGRIQILDTQTKNATDVKLSSNDYARFARLSRDGTLLYFTVTKSESNIWLLDLTQN